MSRLLRLVRTVRHLRPVQIWGRVWFRLHRPRVDRRPAPALRSAVGVWQACARHQSMTGPRRFRFIGAEHVLDTAVDWCRDDWPRLWLYNLHYFDDLAATDAASRSDWHRALITRWIEDNPPASRPGWEPYPTSLRIVNWIKWALAGHGLELVWRDSLACQARWLRQREEVHLQGNHLWANAKALVFAGACFEGAEAEGWLQRGLRRLRRELAEQILPDGGHYERSPMYHAIVLEDLIDLIQLAARYPGRIDGADQEDWRQTAVRMLRWLRVMSHPDGHIALFNDAAFDIAPPYAALKAYARSQGIAADDEPLAVIEALPDSGYVRLAAGPAVLIADVGPVGPDHLPGHAHADTLSFELSLHGRRVLVNGGTSTYELGPERLRQRGTAAHNTVSVNQQDSSEVWSSFRVARRAYPLDVAWDTEGEELCLRAAHEGYRRLPGRPLHRREWRLSPRHLAVTDTIGGRFDQATAHLHLHPDWQVTMDGANDGLVTVGQQGEAPWRWHATAPSSVTLGTWHPRFGEALPCTVIEAAFDGAEVEFTLTWV